MSFGAIIAVKNGGLYEPVDFGLECALTEIRVEQTLGNQTTFALRFQEDYENDQPTVTEHDIFKSGVEIAILVPNGSRSQELICLVCGQVEQLSFDIALGGPGSSFEARGRDVRTILDRVCVPESLTATKSASLIKEFIKEIPDIISGVEDGAIIYDGEDDNPSINFVGTKLELIEQLATAEDQCVWLSYEVSSDKRGIPITTTFNVKPSPPRSDPPPPPPNPAAAKRELRVLSDSKECPNIATFKVSSDNERITVVHTAAIDGANGGAAKAQGTTADDKLNDGPGPGESGNAGSGEAPERTSCSPGPGGQTERAQKAETMATDESWFITAEALTSASMVQGVLEPHQEVTVMGVGCEWAGQYQVREVTHVINAAEHWMNVTLRSNSRGEKKL